MDLHQDSAVIDDLGGPTAVAALCRIKPQAVSQWRRTGIPPARRDYLALLKPEAFQRVEAASQEARDAA
jgi:hypothetical protein